MKKVHWAEIEKISGDEAVLTITVSNGTYVKELVTGDDGRTEPSISSILNTNCTVKGLEVLKIHNGDRIW
jgi:tRNA pseudouridine synthase 10